MEAEKLQGSSGAQSSGYGTTPTTPVTVTRKDEHEFMKRMDSGWLTELGTRETTPPTTPRVIPGRLSDAHVNANTLKLAQDTAKAGGQAISEEGDVLGEPIQTPQKADPNEDRAEQEGSGTREPQRGGRLTRWRGWRS